MNVYMSDARMAACAWLHMSCEFAFCCNFAVGTGVSALENAHGGALKPCPNGGLTLEGETQCVMRAFGMSRAPPFFSSLTMS